MSRTWTDLSSLQDSRLACSPLSSFHAYTLHFGNAERTKKMTRYDTHFSYDFSLLLRRAWYECLLSALIALAFFYIFCAFAAGDIRRQIRENGVYGWKSSFFFGLLFFVFISSQMYFSRGLFYAQVCLLYFTKLWDTRLVMMNQIGEVQMSRSILLGYQINNCRPNSTFSTYCYCARVWSYGEHGEVLQSGKEEERNQQDSFLKTMHGCYTLLENQNPCHQWYLH
jgi:hypothetical protein